MLSGSRSVLEKERSRRGVTGLGVDSGALLADVGRLPEPLRRWWTFELPINSAVSAT